MKKRYFYITYTARNKVTKAKYEGFMTITTDDNHPSYHEITKFINLPLKEDIPNDKLNYQIIINNIHEFKNVQDFDDFCVWEEGDFQPKRDSKVMAFLESYKIFLQEKLQYNEEQINTQFQLEGFNIVLDAYADNFNDISEEGDPKEFYKMLFNI